MLWSKISVILAMQMVLGWALGRVGIPLLRRLKTGRYDPYVGDRFSADGSEPAFGGAAALIVLTFGISAAAAVCGGGRRLYLACGSIALATLAGAADDLLTDVFGKNYGASAAAKLGWCYAASFVYLLICRKMQIIETAVLLPFHLGTIDFGALFCPVMAAAMTALIYSYKYFNRFGTDGSTCAEGLCAAQIFLAGLLFCGGGRRYLRRYRANFRLPHGGRGGFIADMGGLPREAEKRRFGRVFLRRCCGGDADILQRA